MPKTKAEFRRKYSPTFERLEIQNYYLDYFYNLYMNNYKFNGVTPEENWFILNQYWETGKICAFNIKVLSMTIFARFSENEYNLYNYPIKALPIPVSSEWKIPKYFPKKPLVINEEIVISYILKNRKPIKEFVLFNVRKIAQVELLISSNINSLKMPYLVAVTPEDKERMKNIVDNILQGEQEVYLSASDIANIKVLLTQAPYLVDKLYQYVKQLINDTLTRLGINNVDIEKKEHLIVDEANANNELISDNEDVILDEMEIFAQKCNDILGKNMSVEVEEDEDEEDEEDENN